MNFRGKHSGKEGSRKRGCDVGTKRLMRKKEAEMQKRIKQFRMVVLVFSLFLVLANYCIAGCQWQPYISKRTTAAPVINGVLDEPCWLNAPKIEFVKQTDGQPAKHKTDAYVSWDDQALYFAFVNYESDISHVKAKTVERDGKGMWGHDDTIEIFLDPKGDGDSYYQIMINSNGCIWDAHYTYDGGYRIQDIKWDAAIQAKTRIMDDRWVIEVKIPFSDLEETGIQGMKWCANFNRVRPGEEPGYSSWSPTFVLNSHDCRRFGILEFK